jgi:dTDP-4-amino-4,6-dideoxygalactose transaminase
MNEIGKLGRPGLSGTCCEVYLEKAFSAADLSPGDRLSTARWLTENSLMLPVHPALSSEDIEDIAGTVAQVVEEATG